MFLNKEENVYNDKKLMQALLTELYYYIYNLTILITCNVF